MDFATYVTVIAINGIMMNYIHNKINGNSDSSVTLNTITIKFIFFYEWFLHNILQWFLE